MHRSLPHSVAVVLAMAAAALLAAPAARAAPVCGEGTYAYAGFDLPRVTTGVSAVIDAAGPVDVRDGHVAGWIGVVAPDSGDAWLQVGLSALPGDTTSGFYYEVAFPGHAPVYHALRGIASGRPHRFAVLELSRRPGWWRVWADGKPQTPPLHLPGSHDRWTAQVLGESWAGATSGACNGYTYAFSHVSILRARGRSLSGLTGVPLGDPNYVVAQRRQSSFVATIRP